MLHVRVISPGETTGEVLAAIRDDPTVANLVLLRGVALGGRGDLFMFDLARESANPILQQLRRLGLERSGSIAFSEQDTLLSAAAEKAEQAAPGRPSDGVIWDAIEADARESSKLSWSFAVFLLLAVLLAGIGRYLDQPILIVGAMVVAPEFAPISAICFGLARGRRHLVPPALGTLVGGYVGATVVAVLVWFTTAWLGQVDGHRATSGPQTQFIIHPDGWSFAVALLAGVAGVLALTAAKSGTLVGVFISVVTVPAAGTVALTAAVGAWAEAGSSLLQLIVNLAGMVLAGTVTLLVQRVLWHRVVVPRQQERDREPTAD